MFISVDWLFSPTEYPPKIVVYALNKLGSMVKDFRSNASIPGCITNHSLRVTGVSDLFQAGVPKKYLVIYPMIDYIIISEL